MAHEGRIGLNILPHNSPELNVDEHLSNDAKGQVNAEGLPGNKPELHSWILSHATLAKFAPTCQEPF